MNRDLKVEIRKNILLSVVLHLMIIPIAFTINSRSASHRAPADFLKITLFNESEEPKPLTVQERGKNKENIAEGMFSVDATKGDPEKHRGTIENRTTSDTAFNHNPVPISKIGSRDVSPAFDSIKGKSKGDLSVNQSKAYNTSKISLTSSGVSETNVEENPSQLNADHKNISRLQANVSNPDIIEIIRSSIDKAKRYPEIAKKRGWEGTVIAEFSINRKGAPENITIVRGSGYGILDSAARDTIIKASPLPVIKGKLEIPITFRLKKEN